jgi:hypothetical protein
MKKFLTAIMVVSFLFFVACDTPRKPTPTISVAEALKNFASCYNRQASFAGYITQDTTFTEGVVVFKKDATFPFHSVLIVVPRPFPRITSIVELHENEVLPIEVLKADVEIGAIINVRGSLEKAEKDGREIYYVKATALGSKLEIVGRENIDDPDFEKLVEIIIQKSKDDNDFLLFYYFFFMGRPKPFK